MKPKLNGCNYNKIIYRFKINFNKNNKIFKIWKQRIINVYLKKIKDWLNGIIYHKNSQNGKEEGQK